MEKLKPIGKPNAKCLCCGETTELMTLETVLCNGFGGWSITKNGELFFQDDQNKEWEEFKTLKDIEGMIGENTEDDFRAILFTPLRGAEYQRHSKNNWVLIRTDEGFA